MKIKFDAGARLSTFLPCQQIFTYENNLINFIQHEAILGGAFLLLLPRLTAPKIIQFTVESHRFTSRPEPTEFPWTVL
jgi:hypothetical protein